MEVYLAFFLILIPLFWVGAADGTHDFLSVIFSIPVWIYWAFTGIPIFEPMFMIILFMVMSISWSSLPKYSLYDFLLLTATFTVAMAASMTNSFSVMFYSFLPVPGMAALEIYQHFFVKHDRENQRGSLFGNTNHSGSYFAINTFIGLWLTWNISLIFAPFIVLLLFGLFCARCRAAILGLFFGLGTVTAILYGMWGFLAMLVLLVVGLLVVATQRPPHHIKAAILFRGKIFWKAIRLIMKKPLFGYGLFTFRKEQQLVSPPYATHRIHNDMLEFIFELGLVGFALFIYFYSSLKWSDPFLSAGVVCALVTSMFFFVFREAHTAGPAMAMIGLMIPSVHVVNIPWLVALVFIAGLSYIFYVVIVKRMMALSWYAKGSFSRDGDYQEICVNKAVEWFPSTEYLSKAAFYASNRSPEKCFEYAAQMVYNYDGRVLIWSALDQLSRTCLLVGAVNLSAYFNKRSMDYNKEYREAKHFKEVRLDPIFKRLEEERNARMDVH